MRPLQAHCHRGLGMLYRATWDGWRRRVQRWPRPLSYTALWR
jgi:hypothetical protein